MSVRAGRIEILSWYLYDFADSSFTTLIVTVGYSLYFRSVVAADAGSAGSFYWGLSIALSMALVAITAPVLGAIADLSGRKKPFLIGFALTAILFTALLTGVSRGDLLTGMALFIVANYGFEGAHVFYNGFLPEIASETEMGRISGHGWAVGYLGALAALLICHPLTRAGLSGPGSDPDRFRLSFAVVALFYLVFSAPIMLWLRERAPRRHLPLLRLARGGGARLAQTFRQVRALPDLWRFLVAFIIYNDGVATVIAFSAIYAMGTIGFSMAQVTLLFIVTQVTAFIGAFVAGHLVDRWGARPTIAVTLILWCLVVTGAYLARNVPQFFAVGVAASLGMGSTQTASRSLMGLLIPPGRNAEFFGFYAFTGKISAIVGPLLYGAVGAWAGSDRPAVLTLVVFFALGLVLLLGVDVTRGRAEAARYPDASPGAGAPAVAS